MQEYRVLVVDDDPSWQENFRETIESLDYVVQVAGSYEEADASLDRQHFHLVLVDLRLKAGARELEGMKLVQKIAGLDEGTNTIIVSGYADATIATEALKRYDAFYVIEKEKIDPDRFMELTKDAVARAREQYRSRFVSAIDFLRRDQDTHSWAAQVLRAIVGEDGTLGLRDLDQLRDLLNQLLEDLFPLLTHRSDKDVRFDREAGVIDVRCWSKALGEPIGIRFGKRELIDQEITDVELSSELLARRGYVRIERVHTVGELGGVVHILVDVPFEDFTNGDL